jgi:hypothetical protein
VRAVKLDAPGVCRTMYEYALPSENVSLVILSLVFISYVYYLIFHNLLAVVTPLSHYRGKLSDDFTMM